MARQGRKYDKANGMRLTDCCGGFSTVNDDQGLVCEVCHGDVGTGEGDGTEFSRVCKTVGCEALASTSGSGRGFCPKCYQRARRLEKGMGKTAPGAEVPVPLARGGGRELRAMCSFEVVVVLSGLAAARDLEEVEFVRQALTFMAGLGPDPRSSGRRAG